MSTTPQGGAAQAVATPPESGAPQAAPAAIPDLTKDENFRKYQAEQDKRYSQIQRELAEERARRVQAEEAARARQLAELDALDPVEQTRILKQQLAERTEKERATAQMQAAYAEAQQLLQAAGIAVDDPRLNDPRVSEAWARSGDAGVKAIAARIAEIAAEDKRTIAAELEALKKGGQQQQQVVAAQAANKALADAGVLATSNGGGSAVTVQTDRDRHIADGKARLAKLRGTGDDVGMARLRADLRAKGLSMADLT